MFWGLMQAAQCNGNYSFENHFIKINKAMCSLLPIAIVTLALFVVKFVLELILKLKVKNKTEPVN